MPEKLRGVLLILFLCAAVSVLGFLNSQNTFTSEQEREGSPSSEQYVQKVLQLPEKQLSCLNVDNASFLRALDGARSYNLDKAPAALVVPHHLTAGTLISGAFKTAAEQEEYDTVIIVAPNHAADISDVILTDKSWNVGDGVDCDAEILDYLKNGWNSSAEYVFDDKKLEYDHSASALIPFIDRYFVKAKVLPVLVSKALTLDETLYIADTIYSAAKDSDKKVLLVCSVDFSHYLTPEQSRIRDRQTLEAIENSDYVTIHSFSNDNLDSPASLIIFLRYLELCGSSASVLDNTDTSSFSDTPVASTTSYFILAG